ncbi:ABC transporter substrate-binding protein [Glycomyces albidus]|uniref:Substrate-binding domain-containing protein n=1 Tax=Glycomyces albidus TaxID=2656774 RepID=A0A6L5G6G9_9ACTN|nr:ABC transporter substrate-binding protein [Glycomyces albidus]MQM25188.1 substrate-binding domain-containing protein [Glycomyces albidus]
MLKQVLAGIGAGALLFGLTACGGGDDSGDGGGSGDGLVVGFAQVGAESAWRTANSESVQAAAEADDRIAELKFVDAQQDQEKQIEAVRNFITQQVDVIVLAPVVETGWTDVLQEAADAGIPVVLADRGVEAADEDLYVTRLGSDFAEEGRKAGAWAVETFAEDPDGTTRILELQGTTGSAPANDRKAGFFEVLDAEGLPYELVDSQSGNFTAEEGKAVMETFITTHGLDGIDLLYAHNDEMGLGAIQAIEEAGYQPGTDIQIIIVDGSKAGFQAGVDGKLNYIVECNPVFGEQLMDVVVQVANGEEVEKFTPVEEGVFDASQFEAELPNRKF